MIFVFKFSVLFFLGQLCSIRVRLSSLFQDKRVVGEESFPPYVHAQSPHTMSLLC